MAGYRIHCPDSAAEDERFDAPDDAEALELVRLRLVPFDCELWSGPRLVAILPRDGGAVRPAR